MIRKSMKLGALLTAAILVGCAPRATVQSSEDIAAEFDLPPYDGPRIPIAVGPCEDRSGQGGVQIEGPEGQTRISMPGEVGQGMADMLVTALVNTDRFDVLESDASVLRDMSRERGYGGDSTHEEALEGAELLVSCAVTEFEPKAVGGGGGVGDLFGGVVGLIAGGANKSTVGIDFRLVDPDTRRILQAFSVHGEATDFAGGALFGDLFGPAAGLGGYKNEPIEKAIRLALKKAVEEIALQAPDEYQRLSGATERRNAGEGSAAASRSGDSMRAATEQSSQANSTEEGTPVRVTAEALNLRANPSTAADVIRTLPRGTRLKMIDRRAGWCKVATRDGETGWVYGTYVTEIQGGTEG